MKRILLFLMFVLLGILGCTDKNLNNSVPDTNGVSEGATIATIYEQIIAINASISHLREMDETLDGYIGSLNATVEELQSQINSANVEIENLESELKGEVNSLKQDLLNELNAAKEDIESKLNEINGNLEALNAVSIVLDGKISNLQTYVDSQLASVKNWTNATFATLTQYEQIQTEISTLKASIELLNSDIVSLEENLKRKIENDIKVAVDVLREELSTDYMSRIESAVSDITTSYTVAISIARSEITTAYTQAIDIAIADSENSIKAWVNTILAQGYYDIATVDGKLSILSNRLDDKDNDLQKQIEEQRLALETAKTQLTAGYEKAISEAININNGVINASIESAVQKLQDEINGRLSVIDGQILVLQNSLNAVIDGICNTVQSMIHIPEYSDKTVKMNADTKLISLNFLISPAYMATAIHSAWTTNKDVISAFIIYTKDPATRSTEREIPLLVQTVCGNGNGVLTIELTENEDYPLDDDFLMGKKDAVVYVRLSDENTDICSEPILIDNFQESCQVALNTVTATTATFDGYIGYMPEDMGLVKLTMYYSDSEFFSIYDESVSRVDIFSFESDGTFSITLSGLQYNTTYNYCVVAKVREKELYGDVMQFRTNNIVLTVTHNSLMGTSAEVSCRFTGMSDVDRESMEAGIFYSKSRSGVGSGSGTKVVASIIKDEGRSSIKLTGLLPSTRYYYCSYILQGEEYVFSEVNDFLTVPI